MKASACEIKVSVDREAGTVFARVGGVEVLCEPGRNRLSVMAGGDVHELDASDLDHLRIAMCLITQHVGSVSVERDDYVSERGCWGDGAA